jgi:hypothetical protein
MGDFSKILNRLSLVSVIVAGFGISRIGSGDCCAAHDPSEDNPIDKQKTLQHAESPLSRRKA